MLHSCWVHSYCTQCLNTILNSIKGNLTKAAWNPPVYIQAGLDPALRHHSLCLSCCPQFAEVFSRKPLCRTLAQEAAVLTLHRHSWFLTIFRPQQPNLFACSGCLLTFHRGTLVSKHWSQNHSQVHVLCKELHHTRASQMQWKYFLLQVRILLYGNAKFS